MTDNLPRFGDAYRQYFNKDLEVVEIRRKSKTEGNVSITEAMELILTLLKQHQLTFVPNKSRDDMLMFPFMFKKPREGDVMINGVTGEKYTVQQLIINPESKKWEGVIKLDMPTPPSIDKRHYLYWEKNDNYIEFDHMYPSSIANQLGANMENTMKNPPPITPTITWTLVRREPGGLNKAFESRKELKPRLRESFKDPLDPGYTVQVYGRYFDNIIEFECWSNDHKSSERLVWWFESFLNQHSAILRQCGVNNLVFWQRPEESFNKIWRQSFALRSTQFYFRTEELEASYERDIVKIDIVLGVDTSSASRVFREQRYIAEQLITGELSYDEYRNLFYKSGEYQFGEIDILH